MKKLAVFSIIAASLTIGSEAAVFSDLDKIVRELADGGSYSSTFSVVNEDAGEDVYSGTGAHGPASFGGGLGTSLGYTQGPTITRAIARFGIWGDTDSSREVVSFTVGGVTLGSTPGEQIDGYRVFAFDLLASLTPQAWNNMADGTISYGVAMSNYSNTRDDAWLKWAYFEIETRGTRVPDGGTTLALLGAGVLGLAIARRRTR